MREKKNNLKKAVNPPKKTGKTITRKAIDQSRTTLKDVQKVIEELRIYEAELEAQNEELRISQQKLIESQEKYFDLYHFAPVGYFTFDKNGIILDVNFTGSSMLGVEKNILVKKPFSLFIAKDNQDKFYLHRKIVFKKKESQTCDIKLIKKNGIQFDVRLESAAMPDDKGHYNQLRTVISDITEYKRVHELLQTQKDIAISLNNSSDIKKSMKEVLSILLRLADMDCCSIYLLNDRTDTLELITHRGLSAQFLKSVSSYDAAFPQAQAFIEGKSVYKDYSEIMAQADAAHRREKIRALGIIPMVNNEKTIALLCIGSHTNDEIPANLRIALESISGQIRIAIIKSIIDNELIKHQVHLEELVNKRTAELKKTNARLQNKIIEQESAEIKLRGSREQLRNLTQHMEKLREEERKRIARELHDELGQSLTALKLDLLLLSDDFHENEKLVARINAIDNYISNNIMKSVQKISSELRPAVLDELGLIAAIEWLTDEIKRRKNITPEFVTNLENLKISHEYSTTLFRITQEALTNVVRHAQASEIKIVLKKRKNHLYLLIQDNGKGIDKSAITDRKSLGLLGMRERAISINGDFKIRKRPGQGTMVTLTVPLKGDSNT